MANTRANKETAAICMKQYVGHVVNCADALQDEQTTKDGIRNMVYDITRLEAKARSEYQKTAINGDQSFETEVKNLNVQADTVQAFSLGNEAYLKHKNILDIEGAKTREAEAGRREASRVAAEVARREKKASSKQK